MFYAITQATRPRACAIKHSVSCYMYIPTLFRGKTYFRYSTCKHDDPEGPCVDEELSFVGPLHDRLGATVVRYKVHDLQGEFPKNKCTHICNEQTLPPSWMLTVTYLPSSWPEGDTATHTDPPSRAWEGANHAVPLNKYMLQSF